MCIYGDPLPDFYKSANLFAMVILGPTEKTFVPYFVEVYPVSSPWTF